MPRKVTKQWTQKDGTKIRICDMTDRHLINTIKMLERMAEKIPETVSYPCFTGEMAQFYAERDYDALMTSTLEEIAEQEFPLYSNLTEEAIRRKLEL